MENAPEIIELDPEKEYLLTVWSLWLKAGRRLSPGWLILRQGRVSETGSGAPPRRPNAVRLDLGRLFLTPALIDAHVHLGLMAGQKRDPVEQAGRAADWGLAAVRDGGDKTGLVLRKRRQVKDFVYLAASGTALFSAGRYGSFLGRPVTGSGDLAGAVRETIAFGADQIKVLASGPVSIREFGRVGPPQFTEDELRNLVAMAHQAGKPVMAHANGPEAVQACARAGADSLEHGYFMGEEALNLLQETGLTWVPTIEPMAALLKQETDVKCRKIIEMTVADQIRQLSRARRLGLNVIPGSDAGSPGVIVGPGLYGELAWWRQAGWTTDEILTAATSGGADLLNLSSQLGHLTPGRSALMVGFHLSNRQSPDLSRPVLVIRPRPGRRARLVRNAGQ